MFLFKKCMKIVSGQIHNLYFQKSKQENTVNSKTTSLQSFSMPSFCALKPIDEKTKQIRLELKSLTPLMRNEKGEFSLEKTVDLLKSKIDTQMMQYTEKDIKQIVSNVLEKNPDKTRKDVLKVLTKLSNFSNHDSFSVLENYFKENNISKFINLKPLTINNVFEYLTHSRKRIIQLQSLSINKNTNNVALIADRNSIEYLKKLKNTSPYAFEIARDAVKEGKVKIILLDGFEAKTKEGYKSFNFAGNWDNLENTTDLILKENGKDVFNDDIISDLKYIFGKDVKFDIIKNDIDNPDEETIVKRLNSKSIEKDTIKNVLLGTALYAIPHTEKSFNDTKKYKENLLIKSILSDLRTTSSILSKEPKEEQEKIKNQYIDADLYSQDIARKKINSFIEGMAKVLYLTMDVYSPRRIAKELKKLDGKIGTKLNECGIQKENATYIVPIKEKSFGLINYQNSKVNNIRSEQFSYINRNSIVTETNNQIDKAFILMDDFAGSGQSLLVDALDYYDFKQKYPNQPFIFAPLAYTSFANERFNDEINTAMMDLRKITKDCVIGGKEAKDEYDYVDLLSSDKKQALKYAFHDGFKSCCSTVGFPHIIPDNCSDIAGFLLENILRNKTANKAQMKKVKKDTIDYLLQLQTN